jgi:integrase
MSVGEVNTDFLSGKAIPDVRFHDLRHSAATILLSMGVPAKVVQEILDHGQISMTIDILCRHFGQDIYIIGDILSYPFLCVQGNR